MRQSTNEILVIGATGRQGGAVVRHLLERRHPVRALCRNPESKKARTLSSWGVRVVPGNLDERSSLDRAFDGVHGVFSNQNYWDGFPPNKLGPEREAQQGKNVLDAAKAAGVAHVVQASGAGVTIAPEIAANRGKLAIEEYGLSLGVPLTIIRSVFFMENFDDAMLGLRESILDGRLEMPFDPGFRLQMIAADDLGHLVALAFERPFELVGQRFDAAGDELTMVGIAETFSRVLGRPVRYTGGSARLAEVRRQDEDLAELFANVHRHGFQAFIPALRALHPGMLRFETYLRRAGWAGR
jgi:uncharacterized protein YbjT (DUF2867 family)